MSLNVLTTSMCSRSSITKTCRGCDVQCFDFQITYYSIIVGDTYSQASVVKPIYLVTDNIWYRFLQGNVIYVLF